ncbi:MAG TPA: amino acid adenylation domain-containing protein, partial [Longimicrobium sp.]|nr:amino acid adenylation domain-containing protein [Longimicrobium sp.]
VAMLAVLKAGASYVPLDPAYPEARAATILHDAGCAAVLVHGSAFLAAGALPVVSLVRDADAIAAHDASPLAPEATADSEAYVIYTSGSTGRPKGVSVPHRGVVRLVRDTSVSDFRADDVTLALTSLSFDVSAVELWGALLSGGRLAMFPPRVPALAELGAAIRDHGVTRGWLPNGVFNEMVDRRPGDLLPLRELNVGGEALSVPHARRALEQLPGVRLMNGYGPTENAVITTRRRVVPADLERASIPIGEPISNTRVYVLDECLRPVPVGVPGELCAAGDGLAAGYVGLPEFTAERFVDVDLGEGVAERVYRTRDRVRWLPGGTLEFLGRMDEQVKVRGFRVEPGEIEAALRAHPEVRDAAVVARDDTPGGTRLVAYVVASGFVPPDAAALRAHLRRTLPEYMLPAAFVPLSALPTTPAGKVDRRALPAPESPRGAASDPAGSPAGRAALPRTGLERRLAALWAEVLEIERVGLDDNFFELGGHSLLLTLLHARLEDEFPGVRLELLDLFRHTTVRTLADHLSSAASIATAAHADAIAEPERPAVSTAPAVSGDGDSIAGVDAAASPSPVAFAAGAGSADAAATAAVTEGEAEPAAEVRVAPLSFTQERFWMAHRMDPASAAWNVPFVRRIRGELDAAALERALGEIVARHEPLRTTLELRGGQAVQVVRTPGAFRLPVTDLRHLAAGAREPEALRLAQADAERAFDLAAGPVLYARLLRLEADDHVLSMVVHHAATDGWSMGVLLGELNALYDAFVRGAPSPLAPLPTTYADHAAWQRWWLSGERLAEQVAYWRARLDGAPAALELPVDRQRPAARTFRGEHLMLEVPAEVAARVRAFARGASVTPFMALLAAWTAVLSRWSGQRDVVVGSPIANRTRRETEPLIGAFVNVLALRTDLSDGPSFRTLAARVRDATLQAMAHQDLPFEKLVDAVGAARTPARHPVFQAMFALQNASTIPALRLGGLRLEGVDLTAASSPFDFDLMVFERPGGGDMLGLLEYSTELFERASAERVFRHFVRLLDAATADPDALVETLELMDAGERRLVLHDWNATATPYPRDATLPALFAEVAAAAPGAVALSDVEGGARTSYAELEARANRLARHLRGRGVAPGSRVALAMDRSPDAVVAMLAVLKAGASYVPIDPAYPEARTAAILHDAGCAAVVVHGSAFLAAGALPVVSLVRDADAIAARDASPLAPEATADSEAYVIYTSGSTGRPKGVSVPHRGVVRLVRDTNLSAFSADDVTLGLASLSFDVSAVEVWGALLNGGRLAVFPPRVPALAELGAAIRDHGVTLAWLPNGLFNEMVDLRPRDLLTLREIDVGGEALSVAHARRALERLPGVRVVNGYGATENAVITTRRLVCAEDVERATIPIGEPVSNTRVYVLDERLRPVAVGIPGELCAAGDGLAAGYVGLPEATAARFVEVDLGGVAERVYRTGDRARWLPGGTLEFLGRMDEQVKVRGFRVEPGEVEAALRAHPEVRDAAVVPRDDVGGGTRLVAYVVGSDSLPPDAAALRAHLRRTLPEYMLPAAFVPLGALPTTPAGKVDRNALPAPQAPRSDAGDVSAAAARSPARAAAPPRTGLERRLAALWAEVLEIERVGLDDNFFELGGHSLLLTLLHARLEDEFPGVRLELLDLFRHTTVRTLADHLSSAGAAHEDAIAEPERPAIAFASAAGEDAAEMPAGARAWADDLPDDAPPVAFLFPGLGDQYPGMGRGLYEAEPAFREAVDRCAEILLPLLGMDVRDALW